MLYICVSHNFIDYGNGWVEEKEDVCEIARKLQKPTCISPACPLCVSKMNRIKAFLRGPNEIRANPQL